MVENPIWKTSYRLVLSTKKDGKPMLQGWAIVDNSSEEDWKDVRMALVSGRPISFQMDLYQPLYVPRPVVEPELFASLRPPTYQGAMERNSAGVAAVREMEQLQKKSALQAGKGEGKAKAFDDDAAFGHRAADKRRRWRWGSPSASRTTWT